MKNIKSVHTIVVIIVTTLVACTKQNMPEPLPIQVPIVGSDEYYENLRSYKKSDHEIFFGWWGSTGIAGDPNSYSIYDQIPDSVDIVALWGGYPDIGTHNLDKLHEVQSKKGTKFLWTLFGSGVQKLMIKNDSMLYVKDVMTAIDHVAKSISDTINKYQIDGFDLDYEPSFGDKSIFGDSGGSATNDTETQRLFKALSQYFGPLSGTDKILIIDGQADVGIANFINYFMQQTYAASTPSKIQSALQTYGGGAIPNSKYCPCEDFESYWANGGVDFSDPTHGKIPSLLGFPYWENPSKGKKGGCGAYHAEYDYGNNPDYKYVRQAIQIMNPAASSR